MTKFSAMVSLRSSAGHVEEEEEEQEEENCFHKSVKTRAFGITMHTTNLVARHFLGHIEDLIFLEYNLLEFRKLILLLRAKTFLHSNAINEMELGMIIRLDLGFGMGQPVPLQSVGIIHFAG
jgi:hypothetical protein